MGLPGADHGRNVNVAKFNDLNLFLAGRCGQNARSQTDWSAVTNSEQISDGGDASKDSAYGL